MPIDSNFRNEQLAGETNLGASSQEIDALLAPILDQGATRDQIPELLRSSWAHLQDLRETLTTISTVGEAIPSLHLDQAISLTAADALDLSGIGTAVQSCLADPANQQLEKSIQANLLYALSLAALLSQSYRDGARYLEKASELCESHPQDRWRYENARAQALTDLGREFLDNQALTEAVDLFESSVLPLVDKEKDSHQWAISKTRHGVALGILGQRQKGTKMLEQAICSFNEVIDACDSESEPLEWATAQNSLGNALGILAHRQNDLEMLESAANAFERALSVRSQETCPWDWAASQNNLGAVLQSLGQRKNDAQLLKRSVDCYKLVLLAWTRDRAPLHWATTFNNLGTALRALGEKRKGPRTLEQAVAAYRNAIAERTRERVPQQWAMTQNDLGTALQKLGERTEDIKFFNEAINAYQSALLEWTQEKSPMTWAMTAANLAIAQKSLAERLGDAGTAGLALSSFEAVAEVFRSASHARYYQFATEQIAKTRTLLDSLAAS